MSAAVKIDDLTVRFGSVTAVSGLSLTAERGKVTAIVGANGAGKTTTVETCEGLRNRTEGTVSVLGLDPERDAQELHSRIGVMLQEGGVPSGARAKEALRHMSRLYANPQPVDALLDRLGLNTVKATYRRMSGGEQQRLKFAIALVGRPELVFLDEPTAGLDAHAKRDVWEIVEELRENGVSIILTTHLMDDVERLADQIYVMKSGAVIASGSPSELVSSTITSVQFKTKANLDLVELARVLPEESSVEEDGPGTYRVTGGDTNTVIATVSSWCTGQGVTLESLQTGRRFEDVFIELTEDREDAS